MIPPVACTACGLVRLGAGPVRDLGSMTNLLARLEGRLRVQGVRVTEAQRRLIVRRMAAQAQNDTATWSKAIEARLLAESVAQYTGLPGEAVASHLCSC